MEQGFPEGLRVLVVVDDPACQNILHKNLIKWKSRVRMCIQAQEAVNVIEEGKEELDIVISDTKLPDMDGFMFVELVRRLNAKLPIILLCVSGELKKKARMLELGACDFVWKPIRVKELRESITLQHHLSRKRKEAVISEEGSTSTAVSGLLPIKEKGKGKEVDEESADVAPPVKKQRMTWTQVLHQKFVQVVNQLGLDAGPSRIVKMMNVEGLKPEQVSSHKQKYLERLKKEMRMNEVVISADNGGINQSSVQHNLNCVAPAHPTIPATTFKEEMPMPMQTGGLLQRGERGDSHMSYNQQLMVSHSQPHQCSTLPPLVSLNPTRELAGVYTNNYALPTNSNFYCPTQQCQTLESSLEQNHHNISHGHDERIDNTNNALTVNPMDQNLHDNIPASPLQDESAAAAADEISLEDLLYLCCSNADFIDDLEKDFKVD